MMDSAGADLSGWAGSGAMALTGPADGAPLPGPAALARAMTASAADLATQTARWGRRVVVDGPALLGERAAITGMTRNGSVSVGGSARFVRTADGWVALNLPRPDDVAALPALVTRNVACDDWPTIEAALRAMATAEVVERAALLGLAVGAHAARPPRAAPARPLASGGIREVTSRPLVVDLSSLWAGPLAASLLADAGARVVKVEGRGREDGARHGPAAFFDLLNHGKECITVDFGDRDDRRFLRGLLARADLVIEGSRPRVMDQLGVVPEALAASGVNWVSITGHGRTGAAAQRIGFGDDAAVSGGLDIAGNPPMFVADAVADPIAGLVAAVGAAEALAAARTTVLEVALERAAAWAARPQVSAAVEADGDRWLVETGEGRVPVAAPRHRPIPPPAATAGAHDHPVRDELARPPTHPLISASRRAVGCGPGDPSARWREGRNHRTGTAALRSDEHPDVGSAE